MNPIAPLLNAAARMTGTPAAILVATLAALLMTPSPLIGQESVPTRLDALQAAFPSVDSLIREYAERSHIPGFAYGIILDGRVVHVATGGLRNVGTGDRVDGSSVFRIASMTKSFTAAAILQLRDAGRLSLDDPVERYVPELASLSYPTSDSPRITIRHLLSHSAGFPEDNPWGDRQLSLPDSGMSALMKGGIPFSTAPGTAYEYSNYGFAILGRIVANVSGLPYARYVSEHLLQPLGMTSSTLQAAEVPASRLAHGYRWQDDRWLEEEQLPDGSFGSMGGMLTSVDDLARWVAFMLDAWPPRDGTGQGGEGPLSRASRREMQQVARFDGATVVHDADGGVALSAGGYGYGLGVRQTCLFRISVSHTGGLPGFGSIMRWLPDQGVGIVAMGNRTYSGWSGVVEQALGVMAGAGALAPRPVQPAPVLVRRQEQVSRLVARWDDALADSIAAVNLFLDESSERRRAAIEQLRSRLGDGCSPVGQLVAQNALRGQWRMRCAGGDMRVAITLAPTEPALVQSLTVSPLARDESLEPAPACR